MKRILFSLIGIILIFITQIWITPILKRQTTNHPDNQSIRELVKETVGIEIPESAEILEFEQNGKRFQLKCGDFKNSRTVLRENISESYAIGRNQPQIYDLIIDSVYTLPVYSKWFGSDITDENLICYYYKQESGNVLHETAAYVTEEKGKEYVYLIFK